MRLGMPGCAARRVGIACAIVVLFGCGSNAADDTVPDSGLDGSHDSSVARDSSVADSGSGKDSSVTDAGSDADTDAEADADTDSGMDAGADSGPDSGVLCGSKIGFGYISFDGGCGTGEDYSCGSDKYEILCECPGAACKCTKNSIGVGSVAYSGCPSCKSPSFSSIAAGCGVPY
jgi:hypothetical protein